MNSQQSISSLLKRLWQHISPRRRRQFGLLLVLMLFASFAEILSIGAVLPFLGVLTAPERVFEMHAAQPVIQALRLTEPKQLLLPLTIAFGVAALIAGAMRLLLLWASTRLSYATGADLSISIYRRTLYQPYAVHCARNSSEVINGISNKTNGVIYVITMVLTLISSAAMLITILIALLSVDPLIALAAFGGFGLIYVVIIRLTRKQLFINSERMARESTQVIKSLQEGLGGIRDVLIDGSQATYCQIYSNADLPLRRAQGSTSFIGVSPRYVMEALGMLLIAVLAYSLAQQVDGIAKANVPDVFRVLTDSNGKASPGKIRFAGLPKTGVTNAESVKLSIAFPEADILPINRLLTPVSKKSTQVRLIGNFPHSPEPIDPNAPVVIAIPEVHRVNEKFQIRAQALNGEHPISVTELNATCRIRKRTPKVGDPLPTDGSGLSASLSVNEADFPSTLEKEFAAVIGQRGENSWITFDVSCESEGVYRARIDVVLDSVTTTKDLYFLVVK